MSACGSRDPGSASASPSQLPPILQINDRAFGNKNLSCLSVSQNGQIQTRMRANIAHLTSVGMKPFMPDLICSSQSRQRKTSTKRFFGNQTISGLNSEVSAALV